MRRLMREPVTYLILQALVIFVFLALFKHSHAVEGGNSETYFRFDTGSLTAVMSQFRPPAYPLFVKAMQAVSSDMAFLPVVQHALFIGASLLFFAALRIYGVSPWTAFAAVSPLFYLRILRDYGSVILPVVAQTAMSIVAIAALFILVSKPRKVWAWALLALSVFLCYQLHPLRLFMVPLIPLLAPLLYALREPPAFPLQGLWRFCCGVVAATVVPLIMYCGLAYALTGHYGLGSSSGPSLMGITTQFVTSDIVDEFDKDLQPIAREIIDRRAQKHLDIPKGYRMLPMPLFIDYFQRYQIDVFIPITERLYHANVFSGRNLPGEKPPPDVVAKVNKLAYRLWFSTLLARPGIHLLFFLKSFVFQISFTLYVEGLVTGMLLLAFLAQVGRVISGLLSRDELGETQTDRKEIKDMQAIMLAGVLFYLANILLFAFTHAPDGKLIMAGAALLPGVLAATVPYSVRRIGEELRGRRSIS